MSKCPICKKQTDQLISSIVNGKLMSERCERCAFRFKTPSDYSHKFERDWQSREYAKDIVQPWDDEYVRAYGVDAARERGWSEDEIRKFS